MNRDLSRSRAILIGNAVYDDRSRLPDLPAARSSVAAMKDLLSSELCGWPLDRITTLVDIAAPHELARRVLADVRDVQDILLVYYVGHGMVTFEGQLALVLRDTDPSAEALAHTAMLYENLAKIMRGCRAATKLVILDCCHAEWGHKANHVFQSADIAEVYPVDGLYYIGASARDKLAMAPLTGEPTYFTQALLDVVRSGIPNLPATLRLDQIFLEMRGRLLRANLPEPVEAGTRGARRFPFAQNAAARDDSPHPDQAPDKEETTGSGRRTPGLVKYAIPSLVAALALIATFVTHPWTGSSALRSAPPAATRSSSTFTAAASTVPGSTVPASSGLVYNQTAGYGCGSTAEAYFDPQQITAARPWIKSQVTGPAPVCANPLLYTNATVKDVGPGNHLSDDHWQNYAQWVFNEVPAHATCTFHIYIARSPDSRYTKAEYFWSDKTDSGDDDPTAFYLDQDARQGTWAPPHPAGPFPTGTAVLWITDARTGVALANITASAASLTCTK